MKPSLNRLETHYLLTNIKGLLIFLLAVYHFFMNTLRADGYAGVLAFGTPTVWFLAPIFLVFLATVPVFVFITGFSSKDTEACRETAFSLYFLPYLLLSVVMALEYGAINGLPIYFFPFESRMQLWYLMAMFLWMLLLKYLVKIRGIRLVSVIIMLYIGMRFNNAFLVSGSGLDTFLSLSRVVYFLPFLLAGFFTKQEGINRIRSANPLFGVLAAVLFASLAVGASVYCCRNGVEGLRGFLVMNGSGAYTDNITGTSHLRANIDGAHLTLTLIAATALLLFLALRFMPKKKVPFLTRFGDASLTVFSLHVFITLPLSGFFASLGFGWSLLVSIGAAAAVCFLLSVKRVHKTYSRLIFALGSLVSKK